MNFQAKIGDLIFSPDPEQAYSYHQRVVDICPDMETLTNGDIVMNEESPNDDVITEEVSFRVIIDIYSPLRKLLRSNKFIYLFNRAAVLQTVGIKATE